MNTVSGRFYETWYAFMKYFYFSTEHSLRTFFINKKIVFTETKCRVKFNSNTINSNKIFVNHKAKTKKIQKYQNVSEWNHFRKQGTTEVHVLTYF